MTIQKKDFIEIDFTGKLKTGEVFDSTRKIDLEKVGIKGNPRSFVYSLGTGMFLKSIDSFLEGKNLGEYNISLTAEEAFGRRDPKLIQMIPTKIFLQHGIRPIQGASFNFDGRIGKILSLSNGRVIVDFNNPLAGKDVEYNVKIIRKVEDINEKVIALNDYFFRKSLHFEIQGKKLTVEIEKQLKPLFEIFKAQYEEVLGLDVEIKEINKEN